MVMAFVALEDSGHTNPESSAGFFLAQGSNYAPLLLIPDRLADRALFGSFLLYREAVAPGGYGQ
ncbi:hypothetical protein JCM24511_01621 [Saitozyma sp. JCM 24511]|nr:hypothetical protein JCM24511_01621 [Saitozyma sp. JCM 24511]